MPELNEELTYRKKNKDKCRGIVIAQCLAERRGSGRKSCYQPYSKYVILRTGSPSLLSNSRAINWNKNT